MIWKELLPERRPSGYFHPRKRKRCLGILATSRQLYREVRRELYSNRIITFHISPSPGRTPDKAFNKPSTIEVSDQLGSTWSLYPRFHKVRDDQAPATHFWECLPFRKLKAVRFKLLAPDPDNAAELVQMWNKLCWLIDLLKYARRFPKMQVDVVESPQRKWCANGELNHSIAEVPIQMRKHLSDLVILLSCLRRLRRVKQLEVKLPFDQRFESLDALVSELSLNLVSKKPFGFKTGEEEDMDDDVIAMEEDTWTVWFDQILDDLPGASAPLLRLERFWNWCLHYEKRMWERIHCQECELGGAVLLTLNETRGARLAFFDRLDAMCAYSPVSFKYGPEGADLTTGCETHDDMVENVGRNTGEDGWVAAKWWSHHPGIPRKSSLSYGVHMERYRRERHLALWD